MKKITVILFTILCISFSDTSAQDSYLDSLKNTVATAKNDSVKVNNLVEIAKILRRKDLKSAINYFNDAIKIGKEINFLKGVALAYKNMGIAYYMHSDLDKTIENFFKSSDTYKEIDDKEGVARSFINIGIIYVRSGKLDKAENIYIKAISMCDSIKDKEVVAIAYLNLGSLYNKQGNYLKALENLLKSSKYFEKAKNYNKAANVYTNIGITYGSQNDMDKSLENFNKALKLYVKLGDTLGLANTNNNIGITLSGKKVKEYSKAKIYFEKALKQYLSINYQDGISIINYNLGDINNKQGNYKEAKMYLDIALKIYKKNGDNRGIAYCYNGLGEYYFRIKNYKKSIEYLEKSKKRSAELDIDIKQEAVEWLAKSYAELGIYKKAYNNFITFKNLTDSIFNEKNEKGLTELRMQYEFNKQKELNEIRFQEQKKIVALKLKSEEDKNQLIIIGSIAGAVMFIFIALFLIRGNYIKKRANKLLSRQKDEIESHKIELEQSNEEILAQRDEIEETNKKLSKTNEEIARKNSEITSSIQYAKRIQEAVLPERIMLVGDISDYFIFFKPRDIVSGDFYWMTKVNNKLIIAAADCTGHGVPGAFMSMLGISFLNEIINKDKILESNKILDNLRDKVITSLHQKGKTNEAKDGMDISLCVIDTVEKSIEFSGAYNPLYVVKKEKDNTALLTEHKGDRMPIGIHIKNDKNFTTKKIQYKSGDTIYLLSDGIVDQFGGEHGRKLKAKYFKDVLIEINELPMAEQKKYLNTFLSEWMGEYKQIDDILVMGLRF